MALGTGIAVAAFNSLLRDRVRNLRFQLSEEPIYLQEPGHERTGHRYLYDAKLGWRNIPNWSGTTNGRKLTINSHGLRDREHPIQKPPGVTRILVLGDSFAWGYGVADGEIFTGRLETLLNEKLKSASNRYEVINTGVSGWGTDQEYLFLTEEGFDYSPDVVVLAFFIVNDIHNSAASMQYGMQKPIFLNRQLDLANVPVPRPSSNAEPKNVQENPLEITVAIIEQMHRECQKHEARFLVMKFGQFLPRYQDHPIMAQANRFLESELAGRMGIPYFDLDKEFADHEIPAETLLRGNDDGHWNAEGHRLVADYVCDFLVEAVLEKAN